MLKEPQKPIYSCSVFFKPHLSLTHSLDGIVVVVVVVLSYLDIFKGERKHQRRRSEKSFYEFNKYHLCLLFVCFTSFNRLYLFFRELVSECLCVYYLLGSTTAAEVALWRTSVKLNTLKSKMGCFKSICGGFFGTQRKYKHTDTRD